MADLLVVVTLLAALGCGLMAGVFFAFSAFVMKGLARLPPALGIAAMQAINVAAVTPLFMTVLFGTAGVCVLLTTHSLWTFDEPGAVYVLAGSSLYVVGGVLVTIVFNVPRNNALERLDPERTGSAGVWAGYVTSWTAWNHVRTVTALAASTLLTLALAR